MVYDIYKIGGSWYFRAGDYTDGNFATRDEAKLAAEVYVTSKAKEEAKLKKAKKDEPEEIVVEEEIAVEETPKEKPEPDDDLPFA